MGFLLFFFVFFFFFFFFIFFFFFFFFFFLFFFFLFFFFFFLFFFFLFLFCFCFFIFPFPIFIIFHCYRISSINSCSSNSLNNFIILQLNLILNDLFFPFFFFISSFANRTFRNC